jgi:hypothetical protein
MCGQRREGMIDSAEQIRSVALTKGLFDRGEVASGEADAAAPGTVSRLAASQPAKDEQHRGRQQAGLGERGRQGLTAVMIAVHSEDGRR